MQAESPEREPIGNPSAPHLQQVIISQINRGRRDGPDDICRPVIQVHSTDGELIAEHDTHPMSAMVPFKLCREIVNVLDEVGDQDHLRDCLLTLVPKEHR